MGDVPEDLVTLVNYLGSVKKKHFITILKAAILDIDDAADEIDQDAVVSALNESSVDEGDQQDFISACKFLLREAARGEVSAEQLNSKLKPLGFTPMHIRAIVDSLEWAKQRHEEPPAEEEDGAEEYAAEDDEEGGGDGDEAAAPAPAPAEEESDEEEQPTDEEGHDLLCSAVVANKMSKVESLIDGGHSIDVRGTAAGDADGQELTPLMHAVVNHNAKMVEYLVGAGANLKRIDREHGYTALHWSIASYAQGAKEATGHRKCLNTLLEAKIDLEAVTNDGNRALHLATNERMADRVALLLHEKADVTAQNADGDTPLHTAVRLFDSASIPLLLEAGADPTQQNEVGDTSLHCAIANKDSLHTNMLIQRGGEPNIPNKKGNTALHAAIKVQDAKIILTVLEAGADVTVPNAVGDTPLHIASQKVCCHLPAPVERACQNL
jgi:ankyrin repeat protein